MTGPLSGRKICDCGHGASRHTKAPGTDRRPRRSCSGRNPEIRDGDTYLVTCRCFKNQAEVHAGTGELPPQARAQRQTIVIRPQANVGVVLHHDGSVRFQLLGEGDLPAPAHAVEPFDLVTDKTWNVAIAGLSSIRDAFAKADQLDDAHDALQAMLDIHHCAHKTTTTKSGVDVCTREHCPSAKAEAVIIDDYETAPKTGPPRTQQVLASDHGCGDENCDDTRSICPGCRKHLTIDLTGARPRWPLHTEKTGKRRCDAAQRNVAEVMPYGK